jgi:hypothetical protein
MDNKLGKMRKFSGFSEKGLEYRASSVRKRGVYVSRIGRGTTATCQYWLSRNRPQRPLYSG